MAIGMLGWERLGCLWVPGGGGPVSSVQRGRVLRCLCPAPCCLRYQRDPGPLLQAMAGGGHMAPYPAWVSPCLPLGDLPSHWAPRTREGEGHSLHL